MPQNLTPAEQAVEDGKAMGITIKIGEIKSKKKNASGNAETLMPLPEGTARANGISLRVVVTFFIFVSIFSFYISLFTVLCYVEIDSVTEQFFDNDTFLERSNR